MRSHLQIPKHAAKWDLKWCLHYTTRCTTGRTLRRVWDVNRTASQLRSIIVKEWRTPAQQGDFLFHLNWAFCRALVIAHCAPIPMTCGCCSCREHITNSVIGVSWPTVLDRGATFHPDNTAAGTFLRLFQTIFENSFIWRPKRLVTLLNLQALYTV